MSDEERKDERAMCRRSSETWVKENDLHRNDEEDGGHYVNDTERDGGEDDVKHVSGQFLSQPDQYFCYQSRNSKSGLQPH